MRIFNIRYVESFGVPSQDPYTESNYKDFFLIFDLGVCRTMQMMLWRHLWMLAF